MTAIDLKIKGENFREIPREFYAQKSAENLVENPFDFYKEKGEDLHWYFIFFLWVFFTAFCWKIVAHITLLLATFPIAFYLGRKLAQPIVFLLNKRGMYKAMKVASRLKQPVFITAHNDQDDTVYERYQLALEVVEKAWEGEGIRPKPEVLYFCPGDEGRGWEEYRQWVDQAKAIAFRAYHLNVKNDNPEYYEAYILGQRNRAWSVKEK